MPKKGTRKIVVEGHAYRWSVSEPPPECHGLSVCVEQDGAGGRRLLCTFVYTSDTWVGPPLAELPSAARYRVQPGDVRRLILAGLARGWKPEQRGLAPLLLESAHVDGTSQNGSLPRQGIDA